MDTNELYNLADAMEKNGDSKFLNTIEVLRALAETGGDIYEVMDDFNLEY